MAENILTTFSLRLPNQQKPLEDTRGQFCLHISIPSWLFKGIVSGTDLSNEHKHSDKYGAAPSKPLCLGRRHLQVSLPAHGGSVLFFAALLFSCLTSLAWFLASAPRWTPRGRRGTPAWLAEQRRRETLAGETLQLCSLTTLLLLFATVVDGRWVHLRRKSRRASWQPTRPCRQRRQPAFGLLFRKLGFLPRAFHFFIYFPALFISSFPASVSFFTLW